MVKSYNIYITPPLDNYNISIPSNITIFTSLHSEMITILKLQ